MRIRWLTVFLDLAENRFEAGTRFWMEATDSRLSPPRGDHGEFASFLPASGDPFFRAQRTNDDRSRVHLDLHVDYIPDARRHALGLGAHLVDDRGCNVMVSPGGLPFCLVSHHGESALIDPVDLQRPHQLDQVCIDIPDPLFAEEAFFWSALTGWDQRPGSLSEFTYLTRPPGMPLRILLQRLGSDDPGPAVRAHLDLACGDHAEEIAVTHEYRGADRVGERKSWTTMRDPAGLPYCLTARDPASGHLFA